MTSSLYAARAALHFYEEPPISGTRGSGTVFFTGCTLKCSFCQNYNISTQNYGKKITAKRLAEIFGELEASGAHNINLVTPTHFVPHIVESLNIKKPNIPIVYNSSGFETSETLNLLKGLINIYIPDFKYKSNELSIKYSKANDYFSYALSAIHQMKNQVGNPEFDKDGIMKSGVIVRHLVLPGSYRDSVDIINSLKENFLPDEILISVMSQFTPNSNCPPNLNRKITTYEYKKVIEAVQNSGFSGFIQDKTSAQTIYTPNFDLSGI